MFSCEIVNNKRQPYIDLCKFICIILMVLCHVCFVIKYNETSEPTGIYLTHNLVRLLGAQFFMFSMGIGMAFSQKVDAKHCFKRGLQLLLFGYLLTFLREILPWMLIGTYPMFSSIMVNDKFLMLLSSDILHFAGLAFLYFSFMLRLKLSDFKILIITILITALGALVANDFSVNLTPDNFYYSFIGMLIPIKNFTQQTYACFSFTNWIIYPVMGWLFGKLIKYCNDLNKFYHHLFWISLSLLLVVWAAFDASDKNMFMLLTNPFVYHQQNPIILSVYINIMALSISITHFISQYCVKFKFWEVIKHFGTELPTIYIISWITIGWIGAYLKFNHKILIGTFENIALTFIIALAISEVYIFIKKKIQQILTKREVIEQK